MRDVYYLVFLLCLFSSGRVLAQHFPSKQYMIADGMPSNSIYDIAQDQDGMMWFISKAGPTYYDSKTWYTFPDSLQLPTSTNSRIRAYSDRIWVAGLNDTHLTVQYFDGEWVEIGVPDEVAKITGMLFFDVADVGDEFFLVLGFKSEIHTYSSTEQVWKTLSISEDLLINNIQKVDDKFLISTNDGLYKIVENTRLEKVALPYEQLPSLFLLNVAYKDGVYYVLGYNWFAEMTTDQLTYVIPDAVINTSAMSSKTSIVINDQVIIFGANTPPRLVNRQEKTFQDLLIDGKKINIGGTRIFADTERTIWVSDTRGLFKFNLLQFQNYNSNSGLTDDEVSVVLELSDGNMILANPEQLNVLDSGKISNYSSQRMNEQNFRILDVFEDERNNQLLVATHDGGLFFYNIGSYEHPSDVITNAGNITTIEQYRGKVYGAGSSGFFELRDQRIISIEPAINSVRNLSVLGSRLGLYTTGYGVHLYDGENFQHYTSPVFSLRSVYDGVIFYGEIILATADGLAKLSEDEIVPWKGVDINSPVYALLVDSKGDLWIGADHGVYRFNRDGLVRFDIEEGLLGNEVNRNALYEDRKGHIWIGTEKGVSLFKGRSETDKYINLDIMFTEILLNGDRSLLDQVSPELSYVDNNLQFTFQCLSYIDEQKINYRYRIKSSDEQWIAIPNDANVVNLTNLEPGAYQFEIQARFDTGDWGPSSIYTYLIDQPFFYKWWFYLLVAVILLAIARTVFYFRYLLLIKKQRALEALIAERTQEIRELNDQLEEKVRNRTMELEDINLKLAEYAFINAHHLRAPLTKIMSAIHVVEETEGRALNKDLLKVLGDSAKELDQVIYSINDILKEDKSGSN